MVAILQKSQKRTLKHNVHTYGLCLDDDDDHDHKQYFAS